MARTNGTVFWRFLAKIKVSETHFHNGTPCWDWTDRPNKGGYGMLSISNTARLAHRVGFALFHHHNPGPMLDHLCRNRKCVNPDHVEEVTARVNFERGFSQLSLDVARDINSAKLRAITQCPRGHEYTPENTVLTKRKKHRRCRECHRVEASERYRRRKEEVCR